MTRLFALLVSLLVAHAASATYSIVARDGETGQMGVAVQSHWFDVASVVPWAEAGVGAVATQSLAEISYGPMGLDLMRSGKGASEALEALLAVDPAANVRQVAMIDADGFAAQHTGESCIAVVGSAASTNAAGDAWACQANMMHEGGVAAAMSDAFNASAGEPLSERMMRALEAAQGAGGDVRGRQSASILVVSGERGAGWRGREIDLRVADHPQPLAELRRLLDLHAAYEEMNAGDRALEHDDLPAALAHYRRAQELNPTNVEMSFWTGVTLAGNGRVDESIPFFRTAFADPNAVSTPADGGSDWPALLERLPASGLFPDDADLIHRILTEAR